MPPQWLRGASKTLKRSCRIKHSGSPNAHVGVRNLHLRQTRPGVSWQNASSLSSSTAVNATRIVPARYKELYEALQAVKKNAAAYVDLSRLDLALQGLENERFVTRIAVLGINGTGVARRVVRLLLADALKEKQGWENQLDAVSTTTGLLLRYGEPRDPSLPPQRAAVETLLVPSNFLEKHSLEILIGSLNVPDVQEASPYPSDIPLEVLLSPAVEIPTSSSGRQTAVRFPVHESFLLANGFSELLQIFQLRSAIKNLSQGSQEPIRSVLDIDGPVAGFKSRSVVAVNSSAASQGLELVRRDLAKAPDFEHLWLESGLDTLLGNLSPKDLDANGNTPGLLKSTIRSILSEAYSAINSHANSSLRAARSKGVSADTRAELHNVLKLFSVRAHTELQSGVAAASSSANWKKLAWYKLFWRVDDVGLIVSDLVERHWLPQSERAICELTGRLIQAGLTPISLAPSLSSSTSNVLSPNNLTESRRDFGDLQSLAPAAELSDARQALTLLSSSDLAAKAQTALTKMLAFSGSLATFAALVHLSSPLVEYYESGSILALGLVFALRKLQVDWETCRRQWRQRLFEAGSDTLKEVESKMRRLINDGGKAGEDKIDVQMRKEAHDAIDVAQEALERLP